MNKLIGILIAVTMLGAMAWFMWTFKVYIISAIVIVSLVNIAIERITGKKTWLTKKIEENK